MTKSKPDNQFLFATSVTDGWILDSGATCHIAGNKERFTEFDASHRKNVFVANGQKAITAGRGAICVHFINGSGHNSLVKIENVLYVPSIRQNLISVKRLADRGYAIHFGDRSCGITFGSTQVAVGDIKDNLYELSEPNKVCAIENAARSCVHEWHSVLGHRDIEVVKTLAMGNLVDGVTFGECTNESANKLNCEICLQGKMSRIKFPQRTEKCARELLQLIHSDICGPMQTQSPSGKRYLLTLIDDFSGYTLSFTF